MKSKFFWIFLLILFTTIVGFYVINLINTSWGWQSNLVSPGFGLSETKVVLQTPTPRPTPKSFQFDENTDLKTELEKINPKVLDEDFVN